jgi:hypothetical protein
MTTGEYADWFSQEYIDKYNENRVNCRLLEGREGEEGQHDREGEGEREHNREGCHAEFDAEFFEAMASSNSRSLEFAGVYTTILAMALSLYGSTVVVGFMSLKGEYIPPCFSFRSMSLENEGSTGPEDTTTGPRKLWGEKIHQGIFLGFLIIFANLSLLCAVIFGELKVSQVSFVSCVPSCHFPLHRLLLILSFIKVRDSYSNFAQDQDNENYQIERLASFFAITCVVLACTYVLFAVIYMTCGGMTDDETIQQRQSTGEWLDHSQFQMSPPKNSRRKRRSRRDQLLNARDKSEPLVSAMGGIPDGEGFISEMVSTSSGSSQGSYDPTYDREETRYGQLT